jgi:hypothetical protein
MNRRQLGGTFFPVNSTWDKHLRNFSSLRQPRLAALARNDKIGSGDYFACVAMQKGGWAKPAFGSNGFGVYSVTCRNAF